MSYEMALEIAGAKIHVFKSFGSYQGDWWSKVTYNNSTFWVHGSFGSCSGCDAFESEFDSSYHDCENGYRNPIYDGLTKGCNKCLDVKQRLISFGEAYLNDPYTQNMVENVASENVDWDMEANEMLEFLLKNKI